MICGWHGAVWGSADLSGDSDDFGRTYGEGTDVRVGWFWRCNAGRVEDLGEGIGRHYFDNSYDS